MPPMDQINFRSKPCEKKSFLDSGIPAANHTDRDVPVKCAVAGRARCHPAPFQFRFVLESEPLGRSAACDDDSLGIDRFTIDIEPIMTIHGFESVQFRILKSCTELFGL